MKRSTEYYVIIRSLIHQVRGHKPGETHSQCKEGCSCSLYLPDSLVTPSRRGRVRCWRDGLSRRHCAKRRDLPAAQPAHEPSLPMRRSPLGGIARRRALSASGRGPDHRALRRMRRSALRFCPHPVRGLRARLPSGLLLQLCAGRSYAQLPVRKCRTAGKERDYSVSAAQRASLPTLCDCHPGSPTAHNQRAFKNCSSRSVGLNRRSLMSGERTALKARSFIARSASTYMCVVAGLS